MCMGCVCVDPPKSTWKTLQSTQRWLQCLGSDDAACGSCSAKCAMCVRGWASKGQWRGLEKGENGRHNAIYFRFGICCVLAAFLYVVDSRLSFIFFLFICSNFRAGSQKYFFLRFFLCIAWLTVTRHWWEA